jgi:putative inorganic carbon (hco3(-)) transporter
VAALDGIHHVDGVVAHQRSAAAFSRWTLALFAAAIPLEVTLVARFGSTSQVLGIPLVAAAAWQVIWTRRFRGPPPTLGWLIALTAWAAGSVLWASDLELVSDAIKTRAQLLAFVLLGWQLVVSERDLRVVLLGFLSGCTFSAAAVWHSYVVGGERGADGLAVGSAGVGRFAAEGFDPNDTAATLAIGIPIAAYLAFGGNRRWHRLALAYVPIAAIAIALTASRGGTLAAVIGIAGAVTLAGRSSRGRVVLAVVFLAIGAAAVSRYVPRESLARIATIDDELSGSRSIGNRGEIWIAGFHVLQEHPFVGVGAGGYRTAVVPELFMVATAHNTLLSIAVELGVIGLALFLAALASMLRGVRRATRLPRTLAWSLLLTWSVGAMSLGWDTFKITYFVLLVGAALGQSIEGRERSPDEVSAEITGAGRGEVA